MSFTHSSMDISYRTVHYFDPDCVTLWWIIEVYNLVHSTQCRSNCGPHALLGTALKAPWFLFCRNFWSWCQDLQKMARFAASSFVGTIWCTAIVNDAIAPEQGIYSYCEIVVLQFTEASKCCEQLVWLENGQSCPSLKVLNHYVWKGKEYWRSVTCVKD